MLTQEEELEVKRRDFQNKPTEHTPQSRLETARELEKMRKKDTNHLEAKKPVFITCLSITHIWDRSRRG